MRVCIIYNFAQHYRASIFSLLDKEFDCEFYFGKAYLDIKKMDYSLLKGRVTELESIRCGSLVYRKGVIPLLRRRFDAYIVLGESRAISTWLFALIARVFYPQKRIYFWTHGWYGKEKGLKKVVGLLFNRLPNSGLFLYGNYAKSLLVKEGLCEKNLFVVHNSLAYDSHLQLRESIFSSSIYRVHFNNDNKTLIFIGRLTSIKRLDLLIKALLVLREEGHYYNLVFVGDGKERFVLETLVNQTGLWNQVWFYGECYDEKANAELIYNADLCVAPGNVGLTAIHSMSFGTPVITHNNFAYQMPEFEAIRRGVTGDFFEYNSVESISKTIDRWFFEHKNRNVIRQNCFSEIDNYWTPYYQMGVFKSVLYND